MQVLGVDIGGSSIKAALVDVANGILISELVEVVTPKPATPAAVAAEVARLANTLAWNGLIGFGFPAVVRSGVVQTSVNIHNSWIGVNGADLFRAATHCPCEVLNDADAAGLAEMNFGAGRGNESTVLVLTLGTGIGSSLFYRRQLFPNLELGSFPLKGVTAEEYAAASVRKREKLSWKDWSLRLNLFFAQVERLFSPEMIVIGGGVSQRSEMFFPYLKTRARLVPACLSNQAGIVGAAFHASNIHNL